jgi:hypothetical protein
MTSHGTVSVRAGLDGATHAHVFFRLVIPTTLAVRESCAPR